MEGSNSKPSTYENDALTAEPVKYKHIGVIENHKRMTRRKNWLKEKQKK